jgi:hypothetical protein
MRQADNGKGVRLEATDIDLLNAIGVGALLQELAAEEQRELACARIAARTTPSSEPKSAAFSSEAVDQAAQYALRATRETG